MSKGIIYQGQSIFDKAIESTGDVEQAFAFTLLNGLSITDTLAIGEAVLFPEVQRKSIVALFGVKNRPASEFLVDAYDFNEPLGIGTMAIGTTFIVG